MSIDHKSPPSFLTTKDGFYLREPEDAEGHPDPMFATGPDLNQHSLDDDHIMSNDFRFDGDRASDKIKVSN